MSSEFFNTYFASLEEKGIKLDEAQKRWYIKKYETQGEKMKKEYPSTPEEAFEVNVSGLYYAAHISTARANKRILNIPYDPTYRVHTAWDLGFTDFNAIIFFVLSGKEIHIIDFLEGTGYSMAEYIKKVKGKDYIYGTHLAPHDIRNHEYSTGTTRLDTAAKLGLSFCLVPDTSLQDGIDCVRNTFPRLYFNNSDPCLSLLRHLENYSQKWDKTLGMWSGKPDHNSHSHAADSLRYLCTGLALCQDESQSVTQQQADNYWMQYGRRI